LWQKICDWFKDLADKLRAVVDAYKGVQPDSTEGRMVADMKDMNGTLQALYMDALVDASWNFDAGAQKITTEDSGGVKYQARKNGSMDDAEIQAVQGIGEKAYSHLMRTILPPHQCLQKGIGPRWEHGHPFFVRGLATGAQKILRRSALLPRRALLKTSRNLMMTPIGLSIFQVKSSMRTRFIIPYPIERPDHICRIWTRLCRMLFCWIHGELILNRRILF
jgi:hypothetical protein